MTDTQCATLTALVAYPRLYESYLAEVDANLAAKLAEVEAQDWDDEDIPA